MKTYLLFVVSLLSFSVYGQQWSWAKSIDSTYSYVSESNLAADSLANFYMNTNFKNVSGYAIGSSIFRLDAQGNELWRKSFTGKIRISGMVSTSNNLYVIGSFEDSVALFNSTISSAGMNDIFIMRLTSISMT